MNGMPDNPLKRKLADGGLAVGTMVQDVRSPFVMQVLATAGLDFVVIDMEHGPLGLETASTLIQMGRLTGVVPIVRVPDPWYHLMCPLLDAGAMGLMIPRLASAAQLEEVVDRVKYPPRGRRGAVSLKGQSNYRPISLDEFLPRSNEELMLVPQIELCSAVDQIDAMLAVDGVDVALVGPADLSVDLGIPGQLDHPAEVEAIEKVVSACEARGIPAGIALVDITLAKKWRDKGMRFLCFGSETSAILNTFRGVVDELKA